jgi:hypothetical protein
MNNSIVIIYNLYRQRKGELVAASAQKKQISSGNTDGVMR